MTANAVSLYFTVRIPKGMKKSDMMNMLEAQDFVYFVEEV
jgi:hypothetical protein